MGDIIYARLVDKDEAKRIRRLEIIGITESSEFVPAFEATNVLDILYNLSKDQIKLLHKLLGGGGSATFILLFKTRNKPTVSGIPFRNSDSIKRLLGRSIKESKFLPDTPIEIEGII